MWGSRKVARAVWWALCSSGRRWEGWGNALLPRSYFPPGDSDLRVHEACAGLMIVVRRVADGSEDSTQDNACPEGCTCHTLRDGLIMPHFLLEGSTTLIGLGEQCRNE